VVGVHSPKFPRERDLAHLREEVRRLGITHPVVNDRDHRVWQAYTVRAWPTLVLLDPEGRIIGYHEGEFPYDPFERTLAQVIAYFDAQGRIDRRPLDLAPEPPPTGPLAYPGKVAVDPQARLLFIADSGHHRVVVCTLEGEVLRVIGSGEPGLEDGPFARARLHEPQGMAPVGRFLYIADAGNHALRRADLEAGTLETVAGTGEQAPPFQEGGHSHRTPLNSPWDVVAVGSHLYVAMAGSHQVWTVDPERGLAYPFAGDGNEGLEDGPLLSARFAQPTGIATDGRSLFVVDSEASAVRQVDLDLRGQVRTLVGQGLFVFGDADGYGEAVLLQHPQGLCRDREVLYIADTYNHKVKRLFPLPRACQTFLGTGEPGHRDGPETLATLREPSGLAVAEGRLYIADTHNHAVRVVGITTRRVETLPLRGL